MPLVINALWGRHIDRHIDRHTDTHIPTCEPKQFQETRRTRPKAWFKNVKKIGQSLGTNILRTTKAIFFNFGM